jgi:hypothetical protein
MFNSPISIKTSHIERSRDVSVLIEPRFRQAQSDQLSSIRLKTSLRYLNHIKTSHIEHSRDVSVLIEPRFRQVQSDQLLSIINRDTIPEFLDIERSRYVLC